MRGLSLAACKTLGEPASNALWLTLLQKQASASFIPNYIQESHTFNNMTRRDVSRSPMRERKLSPIRMSDSEDSDRSEHKDGAEAPRRKPLRHLHS
jgi:hypothetical protein